MKLAHEDYKKIARVMHYIGYYITEEYNRTFLEGYFPEYAVVDTDDGRICLLHKGK